MNDRPLEYLLLHVHKISPILFSWSSMRRYFVFLGCDTVKLQCQKVMYIAVEWTEGAGGREGDETVHC